VTSARYDAVAEFYEAGWQDRYDDTVSLSFFQLLGPVVGLRVLDVACGHGRITRELARQGAEVVGVDLSEALLAKAQAAEDLEPLGIKYKQADASSTSLLQENFFDVATCAFGLSDIDDLDGVLATVSKVLKPGGGFVFSILHPCFAGGGEVSGSWPSDRSYYTEGWWQPEGRESSLRRQVGINHRMLSTYANALAVHGLEIGRLAEPGPPAEWTDQRLPAAAFPVFLVARCRKVQR